MYSIKGNIVKEHIINKAYEAMQKQIDAQDGFYMSYSETPMRGTHEDIAKLDEDKIANHKELWKHGYKKVHLPNLRQVVRLIKSDFRCYSAGFFKGGVAKNENWQGQCFIILDVDDGLSLEDAKKLFGGYECVIATTRNHQKEKNGKVCDRYRVLLPTQCPITCDAATYSDAMKLLLDGEFSFADKACKDPARIYFGCSDSDIFIIHGGKYFDFEDVIERAKRAKAISTWSVKKSQEQTLRDRPRFSPDVETKADWYRKYWLTDKMREKLKVDEKFHEGNRNNALYAWAAYLKKDVGLKDDEVKEAIEWINNGELSEKELHQTIYKSLRIAL